jgi:hypothetical protein
MAVRWVSRCRSALSLLDAVSSLNEVTFFSNVSPTAYESWCRVFYQDDMSGSAISHGWGVLMPMVPSTEFQVCQPLEGKCLQDIAVKSILEITFEYG